MDRGQHPEPALVRAWLAARSRSRGLPAPVDDYGGWRVETGEAEERRRYLFAQPGEGLSALAETIDEPSVALKLCRPGAHLMALLPPRWRLASDHFMMAWDEAPPEPAPLPGGYWLELSAEGPVTTARIHDVDGAPAGSGHAVEQDGVFIFDRIQIGEAHRRRGLGTALMLALGNVRRDPAARFVLTATHAGRALYHRLGWRDYCAYSTAMIPRGSAATPAESQ